ncbi:uncharacterized protein LOC126791032 [Argentina anserina]|uniref:uncharacterized protein LOC126791032 n=1 Tax=Argentina anserina TaxID=57926 RepID=UPI0021762FE2|nr:uncharacterized protein LOC126791032 [Potentilla anserina]
MKPRDRKTLNACGAMKTFGITPARTKTALKRLLKLYDNNWELIEDENYKVLFDVLMPEEVKVEPKEDETLILESKGTTSSHKKAPAPVKTEALELPLKRLFREQGEGNASSNSPCRVHQNDGDSGTSQPLLRRTRLRCQKEALIRESKQKLKLKKKEASPDNTTNCTEVVERPTKRLYTRQQKKQESSVSKSCMEVPPSRRAHQSDDDDDDLFSDSEEVQPLLKRTRLRGQEGEAMIRDLKGAIYNDIKCPSNGQSDVVELQNSTYIRQQKKQASSLAKSCAETSHSTLMAHQNDTFQYYDSEEPEETPLLHRQNRLRRQKKDVLVSGPPPPVKSPIVICLDSSSDSDVCIVDKERSEAMDVEPLTVDGIACVSDMSEMDDDEDSLKLLKAESLLVDSRGCVFESSRVDIASSLLKGEVNTLNSFPHSDMHFPNMEVVEESGDNSYCNQECLLATGTDSNTDASSREVPQLEQSKSQDLPHSDVHFPNMEVVEESGNKSYCVQECLMAIRTDSNTDEYARFREVPQLEQSKSQVCLAIEDDHQGGNFSALGFPYEVFVFQNLIKIVPHIPAQIDPCRFGGLHSLIGFPIKDVDNLFEKSGKRLRFHPGLQSSKSHKVEAAQNHQSSQGVKLCVYVDDITRGEGKMKIPLEGGRNAEDLSKFFYIPQNVVYKNAKVNFALRCTSDQACCSRCFGNCLVSRVPCACAMQTRGGFAYAPNGSVKETFLEECLSVIQERKQHHYFCSERCPLESFRKKKSSNACKGHLLQKFVKECWSKCGCNNKCGNRIIQQGISVKLQVFLAPEGKGWGLRTLEDLPRGAFVCEYVGEIVTCTELYERNMQSAGKKHTYTVLLDANWTSKGVLEVEEALCLDATVYGNVARFINHRCSDASLVQIPVKVETPDSHYYHVALFTTRNVSAMEELTWDYGIDFDDRDHPVKPFHCLCGSQFCRGSDFEVQA